MLTLKAIKTIKQAVLEGRLDFKKACFLLEWLLLREVIKKFGNQKRAANFLRIHYNSVRNIKNRAMSDHNIL